MDVKKAIAAGRTALGIELGSTRIKAVLIDEGHRPLAQGGFDWENRLECGIWTYSLDEVWTGLKAAFASLAREVHEKHGAALETVGALGISGMMHGYLAFDAAGELLVPFRTWRNTITAQAAHDLTGLFSFNIPQRWSVAHLYQAILNKEPHISKIAFITTLAGWVHWKLTGKQVIGIGDASGMFPIDSGTKDYDARMLTAFDDQTARLSAAAGGGFCKHLREILPAVLEAGADAGSLTAEGARLLDGSGALQAGIPLCPPEGDAGTGMVATNSTLERGGNVSAGTSIFAMIVLEKPLSRVYPEIDLVTTPSGKPVAMVHCNNCTSDIDAWARLFKEAAELCGSAVEKSVLYDRLYNKALEGESDCGGLLSYNYYGGEPVTGFEQGRPLFVRLPDSKLTLANFFRVLLFSALGTLKAGMDILTENEGVRVERLLGHGGFFKTKNVGQRLMAAALSTPVAVMESAGEGGAWGIALLAAYRLQKAPAESLESYLNGKVFVGTSGQSVSPLPSDEHGFAAFMKRYMSGLAIERAAVENF
jgi:sugar (pentulose or hexulose) kinase